MKRIGSILIVATVVLAACGEPGNQAKPTAAKHRCQADRDIGAADYSASDGSSEPGDVISGSISDYGGGTTDQNLHLYDGIAVLTVVGRDKAKVASDSDSRAAGSSDDNPDTKTVVRVIRFQTDRSLKGDVPACVEFTVPGGRAKDANGKFIATSDSRYPEKIQVGDRALALLTDQPAPLHIGTLLLADKSGDVVLPFGGGETVNIDTWQPSAEATSSS